MIRQMTATVYVVENERVLLVFHKKLKKWLPPGGHLDQDELPPDGAIREAKEETGLDVEIIPQENLWIEQRWNGRSFERPYLCLLEHIPAINGEAAHEHVDFVYIGQPTGGRLIQNHDETEGIRWFTFDEVRELERDVDIFEDVYRVIEQLIADRSLPSDLTCEPV